MVFTLSRKKHGRKFSFKYKRRRCTDVNSHFNSNKTNNSKTSNSNDVIGNSNLPRININTKSQLTKPIISKKKLMQSQVLVSMMK